MSITVIGCDGSPLTPAAVSALAGASVVAGARRHLAAVSVPPGAGVIVIQQLDTALDAICAARGPAVVLASGDPGFFGIVRALRPRAPRLWVSRCQPFLIRRFEFLAQTVLLLDASASPSSA